MMGIFKKEIVGLLVRTPALAGGKILCQFFLWLQQAFPYLAVFCAFSAATSFGQTPLELKAIRIGEHADKTRMVFEVSSQPSFVIFASNQPQRLIVGLEKTNSRLNPTVENRGLVKSIAYQGDDKTGLYVVIELTSAAWAKQPEIISSQSNGSVRVVIDLIPVSPERFQQQVMARATLASPFAPTIMSINSWQELNHAGISLFTPPDSLGFPHIPPLKPLINFQVADNHPKMIVVIDAGHGGIDSGAIGIHGTQEKQITLSLARKLKSLLEAAGHYMVYMTREDDRFLSLSQRVHFARSMKADLFISFHADSHADSSLRGMSVYTLSEKSSDAEAQALANKENKADIIGGVIWEEQDRQVSAILIDLLQHETNTRSVVFASLVLKEIGKESTLLRNSHRSAGFMVLKAVEVPSILLEAGYLSHIQEEALLNSPVHQDKLVQALKRAIQEYRKWKNNSFPGN